LHDDARCITVATAMLPARRRSMRTRMLRLAAAAGLSLLAVPAGSTAAPPVPDHGSCADFGSNVSVLAQTLGSEFGRTASTVASSGAGVFPQAVVRPEQAALCDPR
jgi:hypothetical protein